MSDKEKDAGVGEEEIVKVTCGRDGDEKPVTEEKQPSVLASAPMFPLLQAFIPLDLSLFSSL